LAASKPLGCAQGCCAKSPLEVLVGGFAHVPEAGLTTAGMDGWDDACVAGELTCSVEAIDGANLPVDDDGQDVSNAGKALQQLDGGGSSNPLLDALFELRDLVLQSVEGFELLGDTATRFRGKP